VPELRNKSVLDNSAAPQQPGDNDAQRRPVGAAHSSGGNDDVLVGAENSGNDDEPCACSAHSHDHDDAYDHRRLPKKHQRPGKSKKL
jgi:hypothetical protein